eukprot:274429_1
MTAPKQYKMGELEKMSKNQMKKILKNTYGKSDAQVKLGHFNDPYRKLIIELQNEKYNHQNNNNNNNNNNSNNNSNHNNNSRNRKRKSKFVEHPGSDAFEGEKKRLERKKLEQKGKKALNKKDEKENKNNNNNEKLEEGGSDDSTNAQDGLGHGSCLEPEDDVEGFGDAVNGFAGKSVFSDGYLESVREEELSLGQLQAMIVDWKERGILTLTNKAGDFRMKSGHVSVMYEYMVSQQCGMQADVGKYSKKIDDVSNVGDGKQPFFGNKNSSKKDKTAVISKQIIPKPKPKPKPEKNDSKSIHPGGDPSVVVIDQTTFIKIVYFWFHLSFNSNSMHQINIDDIINVCYNFYASVSGILLKYYYTHQSGDEYEDYDNDSY